MHSIAHPVMKRIQIKILLFVVVFMQISYLTVAQAANPDFKIKKVVIDPGHGGKDPGAVGAFSYEKDLTLKLALKFGGYINEHFPDVEVIYTRDTDKFVELYKRAKIANDADADLFISIHINAAGSPNAYGTETFAMGLHVSESNLAVAKKENSVIMHEDNYEANYEGFDPSSPESHIMFSMYQNAYMDQSLTLASNMQDQFTNRVGRYNRGVKQAGFWVLHKVAMPSILIEAGFISNPEEEKYLNTDDGITYMSSAMFRAFRDYKNAFEADNMVEEEEISINPQESKETNEETETVNNTTNNSEENSSVNTETTNQESSTETTNSGELTFPAENNSDGPIVFKVQIGTSSKSCDKLNEKYPDVEKPDQYFHMGVYKHTAGNTSDYDEILDLQTRLRSQFKDCFVVAFKNNARISIRDALKELN